MGKTKTYPGLGSLEAELRGRIDEELDAYARPFGSSGDRLFERSSMRAPSEPRVTAEEIVEALLARRASSAPPPPSYAVSASLPPPPPMPSWGAQVTSWPPPAPSHPAPDARPGSFPTYAAIVAVVVSCAVLFVTASQRAVPTASAAEPVKTGAAAASPPPAPLPLPAPPSCVDKEKADDAAKGTTRPEPAPSARPALQQAPRGATAMARPRAPQATPPKSAEEPKADASAAVAPTAAATTAHMDQASKTAQMLREQLGASLR